MAKTMRNVVITAILLIAIAVGASAMVLMGGCSSAFSFLGSANPFPGAQAAATNLAIDQLGIKDRIESELHAQAGKISEQTGLPVEVVNSGIEMLDIEDWEVTTLPADAVSVGTFETDYKGKTVKVTTYEDASYVTVDAYGQSITFNVPESAQTFTEMAPYLQSAQDLGLIGF